MTITLIGLAACPVLAQYEIPDGYYDTATGTGLTLKNQLHDIIDNHVPRGYQDARIALQDLDEDPDNPANIILIYNAASVVSTWDGGATWTREHQWPRSRGVGDTGPDNSDLVNLRPCSPSVNGARGTLPYGIGALYWDPDLNPNASDRGDCSRAMFYMATRYDGSDANTEDLELVNGIPGPNQMGDLARMLEWHYSDPVDTYERRRNHLIWSSVDNPFYYQGNRNPFIDRPEYVWAIWGTSDNDSTIYVGDSAAGDGSSAAATAFRVIVNTVPAAEWVTLNKTGTTPTTYDVEVTGNIESADAGTGQAFVAGAQSRSIQVAFTDVDTVGVFGGTVTVDNTDLTSAGAGQGSADANDSIVVTAEVLDHSEASFSGAADVNTTMFDFGTVEAGTGIHNAVVSIFNLESPAGPTATLSVDAVGGSGDTSVLFTDLVPFDDLAAGHAHAVNVSFDGDAAVGTYAATYTIEVSDEDVPGAQVGDSLSLTLVGEIVAPPPCPMVCGDLDSSGGPVNLADFATFALCFDPNAPDPNCDAAEFACSDLNGDGDVNLVDFSTFTFLFGSVSTNSPPDCLP